MPEETELESEYVPRRCSWCGDPVVTDEESTNPDYRGMHRKCRDQEYAEEIRQRKQDGEL